MKRNEAIRMREIIESAMGHVNDKEGTEVVALFSFAANDDAWWDGHLIEAGKRLRFGDQLYRANNAIYAHRHYAPDQAPELWEPIQYRDGYRVITGSIPAFNPVKNEEMVWVNNELWKNVSGIATTYLPSEYPTGWKKQ